ncbi:hypothetical protein [Paenibacillus sp. UNC451MF]|uniref:hypothetical protein n=1 Tax=Paenibacillus sp. UNC451MF TaxID=1449063 RepID=UPI00048C2506|nr:hypothetical protein [Paenibacillus sp. UNC451MF]
MKNLHHLSRLCFVVAGILAVISLLPMNKEGNGLLIPILVPCIVAGLIGALAMTPIFLYIAFLLASPLLMLLSSSEYRFVGAAPFLLLLSAVMLHMQQKKTRSH